MNLETSTSGTGESTKQTEVLTKATKFKNGTYAARVKFSDAPKSGPDGDHLVQTFFTINDLKAPMADDYAEYDFEYLPNGGWGEPSNILYTTSWETYQPRPLAGRQPAHREPAELRGLARPGRHHRQQLHPLLRRRTAVRHPRRRVPAGAADVDQLQPVADRPDGPDEHQPRARTTQQVDYVLHVKDQVLTPAQVAAKVAAYRSAGTAFEDTVPSS